MNIELSWIIFIILNLLPGHWSLSDIDCPIPGDARRFSHFSIRSVRQQFVSCRWHFILVDIPRWWRWPYQELGAYGWCGLEFHKLCLANGQRCRHPYTGTVICVQFHRVTRCFSSWLAAQENLNFTKLPWTMVKFWSSFDTFKAVQANLQSIPNLLKKIILVCVYVVCRS